jgi:hypothetical protein
MKLAIVHDALCVSGGAERVAYYMARAFPGQHFYFCLLPENTFSEFKQIEERTLPLARSLRRTGNLSCFTTLAGRITQTEFSEFDRVKLITYLAKFIRPARNVIHKSYLHAPFRLLWKPTSYSNDSLPLPLQCAD